MVIDLDFVLRELQAVNRDLNYGDPNKSSGQLVMVKSLNPAQRVEYKDIVKLNKDGRFSEFGRELVKFRRKYNLN